MAGRPTNCYDGDGKRAIKTVNGTATRYVYDVGGALPNVLTETASGATTTYLYGVDLLVQYDNTGNPTYYHADGLGSVRAMSNSAGASVATYNYDAFGAVRNSTGVSSTFKFAGEQSDDEVGLIYLRARYYDFATGRFLARDPLPGTVEDPLSLTPYIYSHCNPVLYVDRSGKLIPLAVSYAVLKIGCSAHSAYQVYQDYQRVNNPQPFSSEAQGVFAIRQLRRSTGMLLAELTPIPCLGEILNYLYPDEVQSAEAGQSNGSQDSTSSGGGAVVNQISKDARLH